MSQPTLPSRGAQEGNVRVHDKRSGISRYGDIGHALVKRTKERHKAHHSKTIGGKPTVPKPHRGLAPSPAGHKPMTPGERQRANTALNRIAITNRRNHA